MANITLVHDCDVERRDSPIALNGDFRDCYIEELAPDNTHDGTQIAVGVVVPGGKGSEYERRGLFWFDLKAFIPASATITSAVWHYYVRTTDAAAGHSFRIVRLRRNNPDDGNQFKEAAATWNSYQSPKDSGTATGGSTTTLDDSSKSWTPGALVGSRVRPTSGAESGVERKISANTATQITVSPAWTTGPSSGDTYTINQWEIAGASGTNADRDSGYTIGIGAITTTGWKTLTTTTLVQDAWNDVNGEDGVVAFVMERFDTFMTAQGEVTIDAKNYQPYGPESHHLRVTYTLDSKTFEAMVS